MLFFLDMETTGLDKDFDTILEVACIAVLGTDIVAEVYVVIHAEDPMQKCVPFVARMHTKNGLFDEVAESNYSLAEAEDIISAFVTKHARGPASTLAGSSIHFDRGFMANYMEGLDGLFSHRMLDVSSMLEMTNRHFKHLTPRKVHSPHRALPDAKESFQVYKHYVETFRALIDRVEGR